MSLEDCQILDKETIDSSIINRGFLKKKRQQAANLNDSDHKIEFLFGEKINFHQIGNAYLQHGVTIEKDVAVAANRVLVT